MDSIECLKAELAAGRASDAYYSTVSAYVRNGHTDASRTNCVAAGTVYRKSLDELLECIDSLPGGNAMQARRERTLFYKNLLMTGMKEILEINSESQANSLMLQAMRSVSDERLRVSI